MFHIALCSPWPVIAIFIVSTFVVTGESVLHLLPSLRGFVFSNANLFMRLVPKVNISHVHFRKMVFVKAIGKGAIVILKELFRHFICCK